MYCRFLIPLPRTSSSYLFHPLAVRKLFVPAADYQNHENADANPTAAYPPVVSLAEVAVQPLQPFHMGGVRQQAALQHLGDAQQHSLQQPMFSSYAPSHPASHTIDGQHFQPHPSGARTTHAADPRKLPQGLVPPDEPFSPHTLQSMFDMPALSLSSQLNPENDACASTPQSQQQQAAEYQFQGLHQQQQLHDNFENGHVDYLQPHHSYPWASSSMGDLQTDSYPVPRNLPNVIRKISNDSTIE